MKSNNLVSIIMTCYNGEPFLYEAVKSILNQTYSNWELIFYDNNSNDQSEKIIKDFKDKRIKYFRLNELLNLGTIRKLAFSKTEKISLSVNKEDFLNKYSKAVDLFSAKMGDNFLRPDKILCSNKACYFGDAESFFFSDQSHLSKSGSIKMLDLFDKVNFN